MMYTCNHTTLLWGQTMLLSCATRLFVASNDQAKSTIEMDPIYPVAKPGKPSSQSTPQHYYNQAEELRETRRQKVIFPISTPLHSPSVGSWSHFFSAREQMG